MMAFSCAMSSRGVASSTARHLVGRRRRTASGAFGRRRIRRLVVLRNGLVAHSSVLRWSVGWARRLAQSRQSARLRMVRLVFVLGIVNRMRRVLRPRPLVDPDRARLCPAWNTRISFSRIISSSARNVTIMSPRVATSSKRSWKPQASVSDSRSSSWSMRDLDRDLLGRQRHRRPLAGALEHRPERRQQAEEIDLELGLVVVARQLRRRANRAASTARCAASRDRAAARRRP